MMFDTELAILDAVVESASAFAAEGDLDEALSCLVVGLGWAGRACTAGRPRGERVIQRYARRWIARRRSLRQEARSEPLDAAAVART